MNTRHSNIKLVEQYLESTGKAISFDTKFLYEMNNKINHLHTQQTTDSKLHHAFHSMKYLSMDLLAIMYKRNGNSAKGLRPGFVYAISNPAWPDHLKIGCAIDVYDRLNTYQTSSPFRDFKLESFVFVNDRLQFEKKLLERYESSNGEWIKVNHVPVEFNAVDDRNKVFLKELIDSDAIDIIASSGDVMSIKDDIGKIQRFLKLCGFRLFPKTDHMVLNFIHEQMAIKSKWTYGGHKNGKHFYSFNDFNVFVTLTTSKLEFIHNKLGNYCLPRKVTPKVNFPNVAVSYK